MTLEEFLLARIAEDEAMARRYAEGLYDTERVLAECAAKRVVVEHGTERLHEALAAVYADHPDYQQEWAV